MNKKKIKIDIVSDVVCPWCYIGKRRLEKAIDALKDRYDFDVTFLPFELNPTIPQQGLNQKQYLSDKFGGASRYTQITGHVTRLAAEEGLSFDFEKQEVSPNTRQAHRIIQYAKQEGKQHEVKEAFMSAYFEKGVDLSKKENLVAVSAEAGLGKQKVETLLSSDEGLNEIEAMEFELQKLGISGVPFYIVENKFGISGAQSPEVFMQAIENVGAELAEEGESCDAETKVC